MGFQRYLEILSWESQKYWGKLSYNSRIIGCKIVSVEQRTSPDIFLPANAMSKAFLIHVDSFVFLDWNNYAENFLFDLETKRFRF